MKHTVELFKTGKYPTPLELTLEVVDISSKERMKLTFIEEGENGISAFVHQKNGKSYLLEILARVTVKENK